MSSSNEEQAAQEPPGSQARGMFRSWQRPLAELVVVFVGVSGAFVLDGCRERAELDSRRTQILTMLQKDFADATKHIEGAQAAFESGFGAFLDEYEAGNEPVLLAIPIPAFQPVDTWSALLAAGALEVFEVDLIRGIERSLGLVAPLAETAREYNAYVRQVLVPAIADESTQFYREQGGLQYHFLWYYYSLRAIRQGLEDIRASTAELADRLAVEASEAS